MAYLGGSISAQPQYRSIFKSAAMRLRALGYIVFDPAEVSDFSPGRTYDEYMRDDIQAIMHSDVVFVLPGWENSAGTVFEVSVARMIKVPVHCAKTLRPIGATYAGNVTQGHGGEAAVLQGSNMSIRYKTPPEPILGTNYGEGGYSIDPKQNLDAAYAEIAANKRKTQDAHGLSNALSQIIADKNKEIINGD